MAGPVASETENAVAIDNLSVRWSQDSFFLSGFIFVFDDFNGSHFFFDGLSGNVKLKVRNVSDID